MIESLLQAGAAINEAGSNRGLAPIHFAAIADSLESFKCLESHGADLELVDDTGGNIMDHILSVNTPRLPESSLYHHMAMHRNSYWKYSWAPKLNKLRSSYRSPTSA